MKIRSKLELFVDEFEEIAMLSETLIDKLQSSSLKKDDRILLESAVALIYELKKNQE